MDSSFIGFAQPDGDRPVVVAPIQQMPRLGFLPLHHRPGLAECVALARRRISALQPDPDGGIPSGHGKIE
jgi:hypothetical protein